METAFINRKEPLFQLSDLAFRIDQDNLLVRAEQLRTRMAMYPSLIFSQMVLQPLFVWLFWDLVRHTQLLFWFACSYALHTVELANLVLHREKLDTVQECRDWHLHSREDDERPEGNRRDVGIHELLNWGHWLRSSLNQLLGCRGGR